MLILAGRSKGGKCETPAWELLGFVDGGRGRYADDGERTRRWTAEMGVFAERIGCRHGPAASRE